MIRPDWYYLVHKRTRIAITLGCTGGSITALAGAAIGDILGLALTIAGLLASTFFGVWFAPKGETVAILWKEYEETSENRGDAGR